MKTLENYKKSTLNLYDFFNKNHQKIEKKLFDFISKDVLSMGGTFHEYEKNQLSGNNEGYLKGYVLLFGEANFLIFGSKEENSDFYFIRKCQFN